MKQDKKQIGKRFDKEVVEGDAKKIQRALTYIQLVGGMMYVSGASRKIIVEPLVRSVSVALDDWEEESALVKQLQPFARFMPSDLLPKQRCPVAS